MIIYYIHYFIKNKNQDRCRYRNKKLGICNFMRIIAIFILSFTNYLYIIYKSFDILINVN